MHVPHLGGVVTGRAEQILRGEAIDSTTAAKYRARWQPAPVDLAAVPIRIINLDRRPDRRARLQSLLDAERILNPVEWVRAVDGSKFRPPEGWQAGRGAYGCHLSHVRLLIDAVMDDQPVWIWEDDALFRPGFWAEALRFFQSLPADWEGIYFGGQHMKTPLPVQPGIVRCVDTHRTHCYLVRPRFARALLHTYESYPGHIDNAAKRAQVTHAVYAPSVFLVGQAADHSDIEGHQIQTDRWWS